MYQVWIVTFQSALVPSGVLLFTSQSAAEAYYINAINMPGAYRNVSIYLAVPHNFEGPDGITGGEYDDAH